MTLLCDFIAMKACCFHYKEKKSDVITWRHNKKRFVAFAI